jgi:hypothetical protein
LRTSCTIAVAMVASAPMMAATMVSDRPIYVASGKRLASVFRAFRAAARALSGVRSGSQFSRSPVTGRRGRAQRFGNSRRRSR